MMVTVVAELSGSILAPLFGVDPGFPSLDSADTSLISNISANSGMSSSKASRFRT